MVIFIEVQPRAGRDYKNQAEVKTAWRKNRDFRITEHSELGLRAFGMTTSREDIEAVLGDAKVMVRYGNLQKLVSVN